MRQILIRIANTALFAGCCFITAGMLSQIGADVMFPPVAEEFVPREAVVVPKQSWANRQTILKRNLFDAMVSSDSEIEAEAESAEDLPVVKTDLPLRLLGTVAAADRSTSHAVIEDKAARDYEVLKEGDQLGQHPGVTLSKIERRRVVLDNGGIFEELALDEEVNGAKSVPALGNAAMRNRDRSASRGNSRSSRAARGGEDRTRLADRLKRLREASLEEQEPEPDAPEDEGGLSMRTQAELFSQARLLPKYEEGEMVGIQLNKIKPGSYYERVGLGDGDVITSVNGIAIDRPSASPSVLREFAEADTLEVNVLRADGTQETLVVNPDSIQQ